MKHINIRKVYNAILYSSNDKQNNIKKEYEMINNLLKNTQNLELKYFFSYIQNNKSDLENLKKYCDSLIELNKINLLKSYLFKKDKDFLKNLNYKNFEYAIKKTLSKIKIQNQDNLYIIQIKDNNFTYNNLISINYILDYIIVINRLFNIDIPFLLKDYTDKREINILYVLNNKYSFKIDNNNILTITF